MKMYSIEIDEGGKKTNKSADVTESPDISIKGTPKSLAQILEVIYEMEINGYSRIEATNRVAQKRGTASQTITDKYCRQIGKKANEIDQLLAEPGYGAFKALLKDKFSAHQQVIDAYFESLTLSGTAEKYPARY